MASPALPVGFINANDASFDAQSWSKHLFDYCPFTPLFNMTGQPALSLPLQRTAADLPLGMQFAGRSGDEATLLQLAAQLEEAAPGPGPHRCFNDVCRNNCEGESPMCGRFVLSSEKDQVADHYALAEAPAFTGGYNIAPSSHIPVIRKHRGRELALCHWGFIPHWAKDTKLKPINAKAESISEKPYFRDAFKLRRCLIPANGYYEWRVENGRKQPYFIHTTNSTLFSLAGIWSYWQGPDTIIESVQSLQLPQTSTWPGFTAGCPSSSNRTAMTPG